MTDAPPPYHFHESAKDIRLEGWTLWASLRCADGSWEVAQLRLNYVLGNDNGKGLKYCEFFFKKCLQLDIPCANLYSKI